MPAIDREITKIEQQRASFEQEINVHCRIAKWIVDWLWMKERCHVSPTRFRGHQS